jgi:ATP-binding cassette subfamily B (MDR/TAP) protein 1
MIVATFLAALQGVGIPLFSLLWGSLVDTLVGGQDAVEAAKTVMLQFLYLALGVLFTGWGSYTCWTITGMRQSIECRKLYLQRLLRQEIAWFDSQKQEQISLRFSADCVTYEKAIGENFFNIIMVLSMTGSGIIVSFLHGWLMSLVLLGSLPVLVLSYYLYGKAVSSKN